MRIFKHITLIFFFLFVWTAFIGYGFVDGFLLRPITSGSSSNDFIEATSHRLADEFVGNLAMVLIENGEISKDFYHSVDQPVNENSLFPVASISKWVTSFGIMKLVEQGKLDLDKPIDDYLTRWHLPESDYDNRKVTIRRLLSHSAGLMDGLGYSGYALEEELQTVEASLFKASDGLYSEGIARVAYEPGSRYMYSGAGFTILQLLIEEISGQSFTEYMTKEVLEPLGMKASFFEINGNSDLIPIYKDDGTIRAPRKFTALAAASLVSSVSDLTRFLMANVSANEVLTSKTITAMSKPEAFINQTPVYGLGPHIYSQMDQNSIIIGHDGSGYNAFNTAARIDLISKSGIIILQTGHHSIASAIADEWIFWKAGVADYVVIQRNIPYLLTLLIIGYLVIVIASIFIIRRKSANGQCFHSSML